MIKVDIFKQANPRMQAAVIVQGIEGHLLNWKDGIVPSEESIKNALHLILCLKFLHRHHLHKEWIHD